MFGRVCLFSLDFCALLILSEGGQGILLFESEKLDILKLKLRKIEII